MPTRVPLQHVPRSFVPDGCWFFVTICCEPRGLNQLARPDTGAGLLADATLYHQQNLWCLHLLLLMPDHLHAILAVDAGWRLSEVIRNWKRLTARTHGVRWQRGFFDHRLRPGENLELKSRYVRQNPVRARLVPRPEDWPFFVDAAMIEGR
jgi:putative transposase